MNIKHMNALISHALATGLKIKIDSSNTVRVLNALRGNLSPAIHTIFMLARHHHFSVR